MFGILLHHFKVQSLTGRFVTIAQGIPLQQARELQSLIGRFVTANILAFLTGEEFFQSLIERFVTIEQKEFERLVFQSLTGRFVSRREF